MGGSHEIVMGYELWVMSWGVGVGVGVGVLTAEAQGTRGFAGEGRNMASNNVVTFNQM